MTPDEAFERMKHSVEAGRLAQAYVIAGNPRVEGQALAEKMLSLLFCTAKDKPCGTCTACEQVRRHVHPDMLWVEPQSKSRKILIDQIRDIQQRIYQTSLTGEWKTCVIVGADRMGDGAGNAFLKTLEEPPGQCLFLLLTDAPQFLLPTIASRCQEVVVGTAQGEAPEPWRSRLLEILGEEIAFGAAPGGRGTRSPDLMAGMARAARLLRMLREMKKAAEQAEKEVTDASESDEDDDIVDARVTARYREMRAGIMRSMLHWYRDILLFVCGVGEEHLMFREHADALRRQASTLDCPSALRNLKTVETMYRQMERNLPDATVLNCGFGELSA